MSVKAIHRIKQYLCLFGVATLLCSCSASYDYADAMIEVYEDAIDNFEDAESLDELVKMRETMRKQCDEVEKEEKESHQELVKAIENFEEDAYLIHLDVLYAESHALWMYHVKENELKK